MKVLTLMMCFVAFLTCSAQMTKNEELPKPETITLKYDKMNGCYLGDTVRFTVSLNADAESKVVYVDWLHPNGQIITSKKLKLDENMSAKGAFAVDTLYGSGMYEIRAYTRFCCNFSPSKYPHHIVPVFCPESRYGKEQKNDVRYISTQGFEKNHTRWIEYEYGEEKEKKVIVYEPRQPAETQLLAFGKIAYKNNIANKAPNNLCKRFNIVVVNQKEGFGGEVITDSAGYFMTTFPDTLSSEWNVIMYEELTETKGVFATKELMPYRIEYHENFAPSKSKYYKKELSAKEYGFKKWKDDNVQSKTMSNFWDCEAFTIRNQIQGVVTEGLYSWLDNMDKNFAHTKGVASPSVMNLFPDSVDRGFIDLNFPNGIDSNDPRTVCVNGPSYKGRPIVWIVNGEYRMVTSLNKSITDFTVLRPSRSHIPQYLDEVKNIFITDAPEAFHSYVRCSVLEKKKPLTVFINTHKGYIWNDSALMTGRFRGYDK